MSEAVTQQTVAVDEGVALAPVRRFLHDTRNYLPAAVLPALFVVTGSYIFTRLFTPSEYGVYSTTLALVGPINVLLTNWATRPANRFYAEYRYEGEGSFYYQLILQLSLLLALVAFLASGVFILILYLTSSAFEQPLILLGACLVVIANALTAVPLSVLPASLNSKAYSRSLVVLAFLNLLISLFLVHFVSHNVGWLLWGQAVAAILLAPYIYQQAGIRLHNHLRFASTASLTVLRRFWTYGNPMMFWFLAITLLEVGDRYVIRWFEGNSDVGVYSVNYMFVAALSGFLIGPISWAAGPIIYQKWVINLLDDLELVISNMTTIYLALGFMLLGATISLGKPTVQLLTGAEFHEGVEILVPVMVGQLFLGAATIGNKGLELHENTRLLMWDAIIAAAVNIVLNLLLVPHWGYRAAAYTTLISYGVYALVIWVQSRRYIPWRLAVHDWWPYFLCAGVATFLSVGVRQLFANLYISLAVGGFVLGFTYLLLLLLTRSHTVWRQLDLGRGRR